RSPRPPPRGGGGQPSSHEDQAARPPRLAPGSPSVARRCSLAPPTTSRASSPASPVRGLLDHPVRDGADLGERGASVTATGPDHVDALADLLAESRCPRLLDRWRVALLPKVQPDPRV